MEDIGQDIRDQILADLCVMFRNAVVESTDVTNVAQLCVWVSFPKKPNFERDFCPYYHSMDKQEVWIS